MFLFEFEKGDIIANEKGTKICIVGNTFNKIAAMYISENGYEGIFADEFLMEELFDENESYHYASEEDIKTFNKQMKECGFVYVDVYGLAIKEKLYRYNVGDVFCELPYDTLYMIKKLRIKEHTVNCVDIILDYYIEYNYDSWKRDAYGKMTLNGSAEYDSVSINNIYTDDCCSECKYMSDVDEYIEYLRETDECVYKEEYADNDECCDYGCGLSEMFNSNKPTIPSINEITDAKTLHTYINANGFDKLLKSHYRLDKFTDKEYRAIMRRIIYDGGYDMLENGYFDNTTYEEFVTAINRQMALVNANKVIYNKSVDDEIYDMITDKYQDNYKFAKFIKYCIYKNVCDEQPLRYIYKLYDLICSVFNIGKIGNKEMTKKVIDVCEWLDDKNFVYGKSFLTDGKNRKCKPFVVFEMPGDKRMVFDVKMTDEEFAAIKDYSGECDYENMNNIRNMIESLKTLFDLKAIYNEYNDLLKHKGKAARRNFNKMLKRI